MFLLNRTIRICYHSRNYAVLSSSSSFFQMNKNVINQNENTNKLALRFPYQQRQFSSSSFNESITNFWKIVSNSTPVAYVQDTLIKLHDFTGLPWWATIILSTLLFRTTIILPLAIYQNIITSRIERLTLEMPAIVSELKKETALAMRKYGWTPEQARPIYNRSLKKQWNNLIVRDNCHPVKTFIVLWAQIPLWICHSVALRNLISMMPDPTKLEAQIIYTEMTMGGFGWIPNLTEIDHSLIFPVTLGLLNLSIIQLQTIMRVKPPTKLQKYATNFFRLFAVGMVPIAAGVPSCLCFYWVISSAYGLIQNLILLSPNVKRIVGIPKTPSEIPDPYQHILTSLRKGKSNNTETSPPKTETSSK